MRRGLVAALTIGLAFGFASCGKSGIECIALPCALPLAVEVSVTSAGGGPVEGVVLRVSGAATATLPCSAGATASVCYVPGVPGTYDVEVAASGFETTRRTVSVAGTTPECGCPTVVTARLDVALSPSS